MNYPLSRLFLKLLTDKKHIDSTEEMTKMMHESNQQDVWKEKKAELIKSNLFVVKNKYVLVH